MLQIKFLPWPLRLTLASDGSDQGQAEGLHYGCQPRSPQDQKHRRVCISFWQSQHTYTQTCGDAAKHGANQRWRRIFDLSIMTCRETRNHIIMLKQSPVHTHLLTILITHHLINTLFNLLPSNTELFGRVKQVLFFPFLFFYCAVFIACFLKKLFCNLNQDACGPDRSGLLEEESEDC